jgi:hypothetical protein
MLLWKLFLNIWFLIIKILEGLSRPTEEFSRIEFSTAETSQTIIGIMVTTICTVLISTDETFSILAG